MTDANYTVVERLSEWAGEHGHTTGDAAHAWLLAHPEISSVISGATRLEQVQLNAQAADWVLTPDEVKQVNQILQGE